MTPSDLLRRAGKALYGPEWHALLARRLRVAERTVRGWERGKPELPAPRWAEIRKLLDERGIALPKLNG